MSTRPAGLPTPATIVALATLTGLTALAACDIAGPGVRVHRYEDPVLTLTSVRSAYGAPVDSVVLGDFTIDGRPVSGASLVTEAHHGVELLDDGRLLCRGECGFGTLEGTYRFTAAAEPYGSAAVEVDALYDEFHGGCPSSSAGTTEAEIMLLPATGCTDAIVAGIEVEIVAAGTGEPLAATATATVTDGDYQETLGPGAYSSDGVMHTREGAYERPGTYSVVVTHPDHADWSRDGVVAGAGACHVETVYLRAELTPG